MKTLLPLILNVTIPSLLRNRKSIQFFGRKCFHMKKKSKQSKSIASTDRALDHFDLYYRPVYKELWPSIRISLLTAKKSAAVINNFANSDRYITDFLEDGAYDIVRMAQTKRYGNVIISDESDVEEEVEDIPGEICDELLDKRNVNSGCIEVDEEIEFPLNTESEDLENDDDSFENQAGESKVETVLGMQDSDRTNLERFIPTTAVYSETHNARLEEAKKSVYTPTNVQVEIVKAAPVVLPDRLKVFVYPRKDISRFPDPKVDRKDGYLCYFMMDAASILPVIALDLQKGDNVLDLCAAPGGKSLSILQTRLSASLHCNDLSGSRVKRLLDILRFYVPEESRQHVTVSRKDGVFCKGSYNKVLVDVPCYTDRHVLLEESNNLFSPGRIQERLKMTQVQKDLLLAGIKACEPGGTIVYSTCTLSPSQNDGVVQEVLDTVWQENKMEVVIEDLSDMITMFQDTFNFFTKCRFGQLVIPSLTANFGPMYFSRIKRIK